LAYPYHNHYLCLKKQKHQAMKITTFKFHFFAGVTILSLSSGISVYYLVELLYALDTCNCISNGEIGMEELAHTLSEIFGVEIKNCYNVYMNIKHRKDDIRTYFFDELREKINKRMVGSDLKGGKFKK